MRIGYACINTSLPCRSSSTFRLSFYSEKRLEKTISDNLSCLWEILHYNLKHDILFFRITSGLIPFASHPANRYPWQKMFGKCFAQIGQFVRKNKIRLSLHPGHFTLINSPRTTIFKRSFVDLLYHSEILDLLQVDQTHKIQIHVGGIYGNKENSLKRFVSRYLKLPQIIKKRLVLENDERLYSLKDCLEINKATGIPIVLDVFHHRLNNNKESIREALLQSMSTWKKKDGLPTVDYSSQSKIKRPGSHAATLDLEDFQRFLKETIGYDFDLMLEVKDKEKSAVKAVAFLSEKQHFLIN